MNEYGVGRGLLIEAADLEAMVEKFYVITAIKLAMLPVTVPFHDGLGALTFKFIPMVLMIA